MSIKLRPYQSEAIEIIYSKWRSKRKLILWMQMGGGKSETASYIVQDCMKDNMPCVLIVRGRELVKNLSERLDKYKIDHSVHMAGHYRFNRSKPIQVCSIDTMMSRNDYPYSDRQCVVILDECFTGDVEILTDNGFVRFDKYSGQKVAQVSNETKRMSFVYPTRIIEKDHDGDIIHLKGDKKIDMITTENHDYYLGYKKTGYRKIKAKDFKAGRGIILTTAKTSLELNDTISPIDVFQIVYQADGSFHNLTKDGLYTYSFSFSKDRKIERFLKICIDCGFSIVESNDNEIQCGNKKPRRRFLVKTKIFFSKNNRDFFGKISEISITKAQSIIEEMVNWDGSIIDNNRAYYYSSKIKDNADFYQELAIMSGYHTNQTIQKDNRSESFSDIHRLFITKNKTSITTQNIKLTREKHKGKVYCVEVPEGLIVVRRSGKICVIGNCHKNYDVIFERYQTQYILGMSATPFAPDMSMYDDYVCPIEPYELRDQGVLVPEKIYCPHVIDTSSLKIVAGDFKRDQVEQLVTNGEIVGNVIQDYIDLGEGRPSVCFAVSVEHSKQLRDEFIRRGIKSVHCDANSTDEERKKAKEGLENGSIKVLCNVDIFSVGWDCPIVSCVILARPTWSLIWYLQAIGRGLRSSPNKNDCIILDNAGNVFRHGTPYRPREISLEPKQKKKKSYKADEAVRTCLECYAVYESKEISCPYCGAMPPVREIKKIEGQLKLYNETESEREERLKLEAQKAFYKLIWVARKRNLSKSWIRSEIEKKYGTNVIPIIDDLLKIQKGLR